MAWKIASILLASASLPAGAPPPPSTAPENDAPMRLHIGDTGIRCVRHPCPARGIFLPGGHGLGNRANLLYTDRDRKGAPPPMIGDKAAIAAVTAAWREMDCLAIEGRLNDGDEGERVLRIDRVIGPCQDRRK